MLHQHAKRREEERSLKFCKLCPPTAAADGAADDAKARKCNTQRRAPDDGRPIDRPGFAFVAVPSFFVRPFAQFFAPQLAPSTPPASSSRRTGPTTGRTVRTGQRGRAKSRNCIKRNAFLSTRERERERERERARETACQIFLPLQTVTLVGCGGRAREEREMEERAEERQKAHESLRCR
jgi:hypothetical protein